MIIEWVVPLTLGGRFGSIIPNLSNYYIAEISISDQKSKLLPKTKFCEKINFLYSKSKILDKNGHFSQNPAFLSKITYTSRWGLSGGIKGVSKDWWNHLNYFPRLKKPDFDRLKIRILNNAL